LPANLLDSALIRISAVAASGAMLWYGTGLHPVWWLTWIAPLPVLLAARQAKPASAFFVAFGASVAGGMNTWQYLHGLLGVSAALTTLFIFGPAALFAIAVLVWRAFTRKGSPIRAALAFASIWVCYEFALQKLSVHSTWGNMAYSQMDFLPVVQIASLAGVAGISFLLFFVPGLLGAIPFPFTPARCVAVVLPLLLIGWGEIRLLQKAAAPTVTVGLIASDAPRNLRPRDRSSIAQTYTDYSAKAQELIQQGARVIVIPEKTGVISGDTVALVDQILSTTAFTGATIAAGLERWSDAAKLNEIRLYGPDGKLQTTYEKHHMLPAFEGNLLPGRALSTLAEPSGTWGLEICKDMDFPALSRQYGNLGVGLLMVPAWDFDADGWLHARMAILRGVESGLSIARAPKQGVLTISDDRGRVLAERQTTSAGFATLLASVPVHHDQTLYDRWGDWFGWLNIAILAAALFPGRRSYAT